MCQVLYWVLRGDDLQTGWVTWGDQTQLDQWLLHSDWEQVRGILGQDQPSEL